MTIANPHHLTKIQIWAPKYSTKYSEEKQWVVWPLKRKVDRATGTILIEFTRAKHLIGRRFCVSKNKLLKCPVRYNGTDYCYEILFSELEEWQTPQEADLAAVNEIFSRPPQKDEQLKLI